jgi:hypothetical protein
VVRMKGGSDDECDDGKEESKERKREEVHAS